MMYIQSIQYYLLCYFYKYRALILEIRDKSDKQIKSIH